MFQQPAASGQQPIWAVGQPSEARQPKAARLLILQELFQTLKSSAPVFSANARHRARAGSSETPCLCRELRDAYALGQYSRNVWLGDKNDKCAAFIVASMIELDAAGVDVGMFYDARRPGMNPLFDFITGRPLRGYYPFIAWRNLRRLGTRIRTTSEFKEGVWTVAAKGKDGNLGILVASYTDDDNAFRPKRVTLRFASGASLKNATCHLTDRMNIHTAYEPEPNADGSIDLMLYPCSFVLVETAF